VNSALDTWIVGERPPREPRDPFQPYSFFVEDEPSSDGEIVPVSTLFLTNRECPWRCLMCDLWKNTLTETVPSGAIPKQIEYALARLPPSRQVKLYNSGSFFDPHAIPVADYPAIASQLSSFERVIVESHPALIGENCMRFRDLIPGRLEVAMGLETVHPETLVRLNKRMTLEQFSSASAKLKAANIDLRVFILVKPPFMNEVEGLHWAERSLDFAFECRATAAALIPTRGGNGALEALAAQGDFAAPRIATLEACLEYGLRLKQGRVFADVWDLERFSTCGVCYGARAARLKQMNLRQRILDRVDCPACERSR
jgi:radical SAM enzyme (TIGR01210 family)